MRYQSFEDLQVWRRGCDLAVEVCEAFRDSREFAFRDQMIRASLSIPSNVAEGAERGSESDFIRSLHYSKGSSGELRTQAIIAAGAGVLDGDASGRIIAETRELSSMLQGLIQSIRSRS